MERPARSKTAYSVPLWVGAVVLVLGFLFIVAYGLAQTTRLQAVAVGLLISSAAASVGGLVGFVFGIPRRVENSPVAAQRAYAGNTNLEQISDWIVKIIVALGLIELSNLATWFTRLSRTLGSALGPSPTGTTVAAGAVVLFTSSGFLAGYLWARTAFTEALDATERELSLTVSLAEVRDISTRTFRQASSDLRAVQEPLEHDHREPEHAVSPHEVVPTGDMVTLWQEIENVLAALLYPLDGVGLSPSRIIEVLRRRGVLEPELADALSRISDAARQVAAGVKLVEADETAIRAQGTAVVSALARLRRVAPRLFEQHVLQALEERSAADWRVTLNADFDGIGADAVVRANGAVVIVEAKVLANRVGGRVRDLVGWLHSLPPAVPVLLVLAGDRSNTPDLSLIRRAGPLRVLMWDEESDHLTDAVTDLLTS